MSNSNFFVPSGREIITGPFNVCINGVQMGLTSSTYTFSQSNNFEDVRGGQSLSVLRKYKTQTDYTLTIGFADATLDKLRLFYGETTDVVGGTALCLTSNNGCTFPEEVSVVICGPGPNCGCRNLFFPRAVVTPSGVEYTSGVDSMVEVEVEFTILPDENGVFMCFSDVCDEIAVPNEEGRPEGEAITCQVGAFPNYVAP